MKTKQLAGDLLKISGEKIASSASNSMVSIQRDMAERLGLENISQFSKGRFLGNQIGKMGLRAIGLDSIANNFNMGDLFSSYRKELKSLKEQREKDRENKENGISALEAALARVEGITREQQQQILSTINKKFEDSTSRIQPDQPVELQRAGTTIEAEQLKFFRDSEKSQKEIKTEISQSSSKAEAKVAKVITVEDKILNENRKQTDLLERISSQMSVRDPAEIKEAGEKGGADKLFDLGAGLFGKRRRGRGRGRGRFPRLPGLGSLGKLARFGKFIPGAGLAISAGMAVKDAYDGFSSENANKLFGSDTLAAKTGAGAASAISGLTFGLVSQETVAKIMKVAFKPIDNVGKLIGTVFDKAKSVVTTLGDGFDSLFDWLSEMPVIGHLFKSAKNAVNIGSNFLKSGIGAYFSAHSNMLNTIMNSKTDSSTSSNFSGAGASGSYSAGAATYSTTPAGKSVSSIQVANDGKRGVTYKLEDGSVVKRVGDRNWRNNNPGNMEYNKYTAGLGAIGSDGRFAIFPNMETGRKAKIKMLFSGSGYKNLVLTKAIERYAPPSENNTAWYQSEVLKAVGVNKKMKDYTAAEQELITNAMQKVEGNLKAGKETQITPPTKTLSTASPVSGKLYNPHKGTYSPTEKTPSLAKPAPANQSLASAQNRSSNFLTASNAPGFNAPNIKPSFNSLGFMSLNTSDTIDDLGLHLFIKDLMT